MFKRSEESKLTSWYFEIDRRLLGCVLLMIVLSVIFALSAGSVAAERIGQSWHFFLVKAIPFYILGLITLFGASFLNKKWVLRFAAADLAFGLLLLPLTVFMPHMINNSARFVDLGPFNVMPSDVMKPGFIVMTAYFLAKMKERYGANIFFNKDAWRFNTWLSWSYYLMIFLPVVFVIFNHPDLGTSILYLAVFSAMIFIAGMPLFWFLFWGWPVCLCWLLLSLHWGTCIVVLSHSLPAPVIHIRWTIRLIQFGMADYWGRGMMRL